MKVFYTEDALRNLDDILTFLGAHFPTARAPFLGRLRMIEQRIGRWPQSAQEVEQRPGVRMVPLIRYPYKLFYQISDDAVEILYIQHTARRDPWDNAC